MRDRHVGQHEGDALVLDDRLAELLAGLGVVERHLVRRPGDADRHRADGGAGALERRHAGVAAGAGALADPGEAGVELVLAAEQAAAGHAHVVEHDLGGVAGADAVLVELLALAEALRARRYDEAGLAAGLEVGVDDGGDDVDVGDAAVGRPGLGAVDDPLVGGLVVAGTGAHRADVAAGVGLGGAEGAELEVARGAEHLRDPLEHLLLGAVAAHAGGGQRRTDDRQADAGVAPAQLLHGDRDAEAGRVEALGGEEVHRVDAGLGGLLDDGPGELLLLVPLRGGGTDDVGGEAVQPLPARGGRRSAAKSRSAHAAMLLASWVEDPQIHRDARRARRGQATHGEVSPWVAAAMSRRHRVVEPRVQARAPGLAVERGGLGLALVLVVAVGQHAVQLAAGVDEDVDRRAALGVRARRCSDLPRRP